MNQAELLSFHDETCGKAKGLMTTKNHDYAGAEGDRPFRNLEIGEALGIGTTAHGILFRLSDKVARLVQFVNSGEFTVKIESVDDTAADLINYTILLAAYLKEQRDEVVSERADDGAAGPQPPPICIDSGGFAYSRA